MTTVEKSCFGATAEGEEVSLFTLSNGNVSASVISWGATITSVKVGGVDVVLGFEDMAGYTSAPPRGKNPYMGAVVGRVANRIAEGKFSLDGVEYSLAKVILLSPVWRVVFSFQNNGPNSLHGGIVGLDKVNWRSAVCQDAGTVTFSHVSKDGDEGYPGDVLYNVQYSLDSEGGVKIKFTAMVSKASPINLANHVYFNLAGHETGASGNCCSSSRRSYPSRQASTIT